MTRGRIAALIIGVLMIAAACMHAGCSHGSDVSVDNAGVPEEFRVDFPTVAELSGEPTFELAADLPSVDSMTVYMVEHPVITADYVEEIGSRLGFEGPAGLIEGGANFSMVDGGTEEVRQLRVWVESGVVKYMVLEPDILYPPYQPSLPSEEEAKRIAFEFIDEAGLLPADYGDFSTSIDDIEVTIGGSYGIGKKGTGEVLEEYPAHLLVNFPRWIGGFPAIGSGIGARICDKGEVGQFVVVWREVSPYEEVAIKPGEQAYQELVTGKGSYHVPLDCERVVVEQVSLGYWVMESPDVRQDYVVPVYQFTGECLDKDGNYLEEFRGWCEALQ